MFSRVGQKRAAVQNVESSSSLSAQHKSKKTRFVEPAEDPSVFEEQVDSALEGPSRKGKVKTDGYDSDSTDDGEGVVSSRKKGKDEDEDVDDMFAAGETEEKETNAKKADKYMRLADIEGQEFGNGPQSGSESEGSDEPEDEDDAERRKKAGMGYEISSFNMREEMEEGKFTEDGSYVRSFDPHGVHDRWMEGLDEREIKLARRRKREQDRRQKERMQAEEKELEESGGKSSMERDLLTKLKKGETVLEALQRLGSLTKKTQSSNKTKYKSAEDDTMQIDKHPVKAPNDVEYITHLASNLMSLGDTDIYNKTYEELVRSVRASGIVDANWEAPSADIRYEYKWTAPEAGSTDEIFGPFGEEELKSWFHASYFGANGEKVKVRRVGVGACSEWGNWEDVVQ
ncbi:hypothetical protein NLJ89_g1971 [Agrocybe chaxingu]|uniref:GYF domain-containing protein n=1 Tax=Agrocybe chaxingu TaxID=84603 RepID=A0A9W8MZ15_9AGAR|nr:hypothetical protein NLJ89_g1971 [Agrocybe chaxingu]